MKTFTPIASFACALLFASLGFGAANPGVEITATQKATGKVVFKGETGAGGKFATPKLDPGSYTFQFVSKSGAGFQVALAGTKSAKQLKGPKSGVAFAVEVGSASKVSGQITATAAATTVAAAKDNPNVKIIKGKRYVYVPGEIGSNMGGKWIPEEDAVKTDPNRSRRNAVEDAQRIQDLGSQGGVPGG